MFLFICLWPIITHCTIVLPYIWWVHHWFGWTSALMLINLCSSGQFSPNTACSLSPADQSLPYAKLHPFPLSEKFTYQVPKIESKYTDNVEFKLVALIDTLHLNAISWIVIQKIYIPNIPVINGNQQEFTTTWFFYIQNTDVNTQTFNSMVSCRTVALWS